MNKQASILTLVRQDARRYGVDCSLGGAKRFLASPGLHMTLFLRVTIAFRNSGILGFAATIGELFLYYIYKCCLSSRATYGGGLYLPHPVGLVVGSGVSIGKGVTIYQNVTLGTARGGLHAGDGYPALMDECVVFAGACVAGKVLIGERATIGANSVVVSDIPSNATAVGSPARLVSRANDRKQ